MQWHQIADLRLGVMRSGVCARYLPSSEFLNYVLADEISFSDDSFGRANVQRLLSFVTDEDRSNRDWAAFLIAGLPLDSPEIRAALVRAAEDSDPDTRDEALVGLARRDRAETLRRIRPLLQNEIGSVLLEAATILGNPSLLPDLQAIKGWEGGDELVREQLRLALAACEAGVGHDAAGSDLAIQHRLS